MALLCFNSLPSLSSSSSSRLLQPSSFASPVMSLKPNAVESKNRVSLSAYSLNTSHGGRAVTVVKAAASGVDGTEPEKNEEPKIVVASVPVDKLPLESEEANSETKILNGTHGYDLKRLPMVVAEIKIQLPFYGGSGLSEMERGGSSRWRCRILKLINW